MTFARPRRLFLSPLAATAVAACIGLPAAAQTIDDAFVSAYRTNPQLLSARAQLRALDEGVPQALSGWRPTVSVGGSVGKAADTNRRRTDLNSTAIQDVNRTPDSANIIVTQPLYRGGQTVASVSQAENSVQAGRATLHSVEQQVLLQTATAFANLARDKATLDLAINNVQVLARQLEETRGQREIGVVTATDVAQAESRLEQARAAQIQAEGNLASSRAAYENVVGQAAPANPAPAHLPPVLPNGSGELEAGILANPDVTAARFNEKAAADAVDVLLGQKLPTVNLNGVVQRNTETDTRGVQQDNATVSLSVTFPLYQAGLTDAQTRAAKQTAGQRRIDIETTRRQVLQAALQNWSLFDAARAQVQAFEVQVQSAQVAFNGVQAEQRVGTRTVQEVLNAQQDLFSAQVNLVGAQRDNVVFSYQLASSLGGLTASQLALPVEIYDPVKNYRDTRERWFGTSIHEPAADTAGR